MDEFSEQYQDLAFLAERSPPVRELTLTEPLPPF
jgi:hypothetical protein